jgi:hypothetical protein
LTGGLILGIKDKLPLINSGSKGIRIVGYVFYGFVFLIILGMILPSQDVGISVDSDSGSTAEEGAPSETSNVLSRYGFGNYTFDGQEYAKATVKKGTDIYHLMKISELPDDVGYTRDGAPYTITSTGKKVKGYIDYSGEGFVVILQPRSSSLTKNEFVDIMNTFQRVD